MLIESNSGDPVVIDGDTGRVVNRSVVHITPREAFRAAISGATIGVAWSLRLDFIPHTIMNVVVGGITYGWYEQTREAIRIRREEARAQHGFLPPLLTSR